MRKLIFIYLFIFISSIIFSQNTGPSGIANSSSLQVWLDASKLTLSNNDPVSQWDDISGNSNHFTQPNLSFQPSFKLSSTINNVPSIRFVSDFYFHLQSQRLKLMN